MSREMDLKRQKNKLKIEPETLATLETKPSCKME